MIISGCTRGHYDDIHWLAFVIILVVDTLVPNRHQGITNHHADLTVTPVEQDHIGGLVQDCSNSIGNTLELLQPFTKPSILHNMDIILQPVNKQFSRQIRGFSTHQFLSYQWVHFLYLSRCRPDMSYMDCSTVCSMARAALYNIRLHPPTTASNPLHHNSHNNPCLRSQHLQLLRLFWADDHGRSALLSAQSVKR